MITFVLSSALAIIVVLFVRALLRRRVGPGWISALWLIVIARMLMPVVPESPFSALHLLDAATGWESGGIDSVDAWLLDQPGEAAPFRMVERPETSMLDPVADESNESERASAAMASGSEMPHGESPGSVPLAVAEGSPAAPAEAPPARPVAETETVAEAGARPSLGKVLFAIWLVGLLITLLIALVRTVFTSKVLRGAAAVSDPEALETLAASKVEAGIRRHVRLTECGALGSPAMAGVLRPRLLLPTGMIDGLSRDELRHVFLHELAHLRRCDVFVAWLVEVATAVHWFNPLAWIARGLQRVDRELACDEFALHRLAGSESDYGHTLLKVLARMRRSAVTPRLSMARHAGEISKRVRRIAERRSFGRSRHVLAAFALAVAAVLGATGAPTGKFASPFPDTSALKTNQGRLQVAVFAVPMDKATPLLMTDGKRDGLFEDLSKMSRSGDARIETTIAAISDNGARARSERGTTSDYFQSIRFVDGDVDAFLAHSWESFHGTRLEFSPEAAGGGADVRFVHALDKMRTAGFGEKVGTPLGVRRLEIPQTDGIRAGARIGALGDGKPRFVGSVTPLFGGESDAYFVFAKFDGTMLPGEGSKPEPKKGTSFDMAVSMRLSATVDLFPKGETPVEGRMVSCGVFDKEARSPETPIYKMINRHRPRGPKFHSHSTDRNTVVVQNETAIPLPDGDDTEGARLVFRRLEEGGDRFAYEARYRELVRIEATEGSGYAAVIREFSTEGEATMKPRDCLVLRAPSERGGGWDYLFVHRVPRQ